LRPSLEMRSLCQSTGTIFGASITWPVVRTNVRLTGNEHLSTAHSFNKTPEGARSFSPHLRLLVRDRRVYPTFSSQQLGPFVLRIHQEFIGVGYAAVRR
jgi:hypothetical protein